MSAIFISHSSRDNEAAGELKRRLEAQGHRSIFLDFDPEDGIPAGRNWEQELYQRVRASRAVIVLCSRHSMASRWCFMEITHARALGKDLFPVRLDPCEIDGVLSDRQVVDLTADPEPAYERLFRGILASGLDPADAFDWDGHRPPYPGLLAFQEEDAAIFFGRDEEIGEGLDLVNKVRRLGQTGLVMVLGASGSGKSSLVRAGLLPRLRRDVERWLVVDPFRPRNNPVGELAAVLSRAFEALGRSQPRALLEERLAQAMEGPSEEEVSAEEPSAEQSSTVERPASAPRADARPAGPMAERERFIAAMRQLESALPARAERRAARYLRLLRATVESAGPASGAGAEAGEGGGEDPLAEIAVDLRRASHRDDARVLLVIDQFEELLGRGADDPGIRFLRLLRRTIETPDSPCLVLGTMRSDFLDDFQTCPGLLDIRYESLSLGPLSPGNVAQIVEKPAEVAAIELESGLVQALVDDAKTEDALPLLAFTLRELNERYGEDGVLSISEYRDRLGGLQGAVARAASDVLAAAEVTAEQEDQLRRAFLSLVRITEDGSFARRIAHWEEIPEAVHPLLESFVQARLLVAGSDEQGRTLEVAHEAIYRSWDRLVRWLEQGTEALQLERDIRTGARIWEEDGRADDDLWRGARLARARELIATGDLRLAESPLEFIEASHRAERAAIEAEEARRRRVFRAVLAGAIGATILAAIAGLFWFRAEVAARRARDHGRVAVAGEWLPKDPTKAALVLLELERPAETPLAVAAMRAALADSRLQAEFRGHHGAVASVAFSPDGSRVLTGSWDGTARLWGVDGAAEPAVLSGHQDYVTGTVFSPDGSRILTASADGTARLWLAAGGDPLVLEPHGGAVTSAAFDAAGRRVATASVDGVARVWTLEGDGPPLLFEGHRDAVWRVAFSPDGSHIATASADGTARLWPLDGGAPRELRGHEGAVVDAAFDAAGENLVTASLDGTARVWSVAEGRLRAPLEGHREAVWSARFTPDGQRVVSASEDGTVRVWGLDGAAEWVFEEHAGGVKAALPSPDGGRVVSVSTDGTARVWRLDDGGSVPLRGHQAAVTDAAFGPDGDLVVTASEDGTARLWRVTETGDPVVLATGRAAVAAFDPDGSRVVTSSADGAVRLWSAEGEDLGLLGSHEGAVSKVAFDRRGGRVASASSDGTARVWRLDGSAGPVVLEGHEAGLTDLRFSPDGSRVATASRDGTARIWPAAGGEPMVLEGHEAGISALAFSPSGDLLATGSADRTVRVWGVEGRGPPVVLSGHEGPVASLAFGPSGARVLTGSADSTARLWRADGSGEPTVLSGHTGAVAAVAFSPDGQRMATASADGTARIWRSDGSLEVLHEGHEDFVVSVRFSPDGHSLVTAAWDGTVRIWPATETGEPVVLRGGHGAVTSAAFSPDGTRVLSASETGSARIWAVGIERLQGLIRRSTALCLDPDFRRRSLGETVATAQARFESCEQARLATR